MWTTKIRNGSLLLTADGATDNFQLPNNGCFWCLLYAPPTNNGIVYVGGSTVTNAGGANVGFPLAKGETLLLGPVENVDEIFAAADVKGDSIFFMCRTGN